MASEVLAISKLPSSQTHHGRTAVYLQLLALVAGTVCAVVNTSKTLTQSMKYEEIAPILAMSGSAAVALMGWSGISAVRALKKREHPLWPVAVLALTLLETTGIITGLALVNKIPSYIDILCLPVTLPVCAISLTAAFLLARRRTRWAVAKGMVSELPGWTQKRRFQFLMGWMSIWFVFLFSILLPCPLFTYAVYRTWNSPRYDIRGELDAIIYNTPVMVGEISAAIVSLNGTGPKSNLYCELLGTGRVRRARIVEGLENPGSCNLVAGMLLNNIYIRPALESDFNELLEKIVEDKSSAYRFHALCCISKFGSSEERNRIWGKAAEDPNQNFLQMCAYNVLMYYWSESRFHCLLEHSSRRVQHAMLSAYVTALGKRGNWGPPDISIMESLLRQISDSEFKMHREATFIAAELLGKNAKESHSALVKGSSTDSAEEKAEREHISKELHDWIDKNK